MNTEIFSGSFYSKEILMVGLVYHNCCLFWSQGTQSNQRTVSEYSIFSEYRLVTGAAPGTFYRAGARAERCFWRKPVRTWRQTITQAIAVAFQLHCIFIRGMHFASPRFRDPFGGGGTQHEPRWLKRDGKKRHIAIYNYILIITAIC